MFDSVAHFVGWDVIEFASPGSASPSPGASSLSACFAGWLNGFFQLTTGCCPAFLRLGGE